MLKFPLMRALAPFKNARELTLETHTVQTTPFDTLKIAFASDIHFGQLFDSARLDDLANRLNALGADVIILGGDYGEDAKTALSFWERLPRLQARYGVCAALGNHDRAESDAFPFIKAMKKRGVIPLVNSAARFDISGKTLAVCATDDYNHGRPDFQKTAATARDADYVIYAPHSPDALKDAFSLAGKPFFDLALCGHTHGGQVRIFGIAPKTGSRHGFGYGTKHLSGELMENGARVIISNGVGVTQLPIRLSAPAQYHLITLTASSD